MQTDEGAGRRVRRVFWTLFVTAVVSVTWLWDQQSSDTVVAGRATPVLNGLALVLGTISILLMARIVWRLSSRGAGEVRR